MRKRLLVFTIVCIVIVSSLSSCHKSDDNNSTPVQPTKIDPLKKQKTYLKGLMETYYLWNNDIPSVNSANYDKLEDYFDALLIKKDRWSWMLDGATFNAELERNYDTFGFSIAQPIKDYNDYSIMVSMVYPNSPMAEKGVTRGWKLIKLNDFFVEDLIINKTINDELSKKTNIYTFEDLDLNIVRFEVTAKEVNLPTVLKTQIITPEMYPGLPYNVGYMLYDEFNAPHEQELVQAIQEMKGVQELIVDFRYNVGGDISTTLPLLVNLTAPATANNKVFFRNRHNDLLKEAGYDTNKQSYYKVSRHEDALDLNRIFVITTETTASACETFINGMKVFLPTYTIGSTSHGKPYGMYIFSYPDNNYDIAEYFFLPICFQTVNNLGDSVPDTGIIPDNQRPDDVYHDFGLGEDNVNAALYYIVNNSFPAVTKSSIATRSNPTAHKANIKTDIPRIVGQYMYLTD